PSTTASEPSRPAWTRRRRSRPGTASTRSRSRSRPRRPALRGRPAGSGVAPGGVAYNRLEMPIHWFWIAALLVIVLIVFGPGRLPELGGAVGKALREFRKATSALTNEVKATVDAKPETKPTTPAASTTSSDTNKTTSP